MRISYLMQWLLEILNAGYMAIISCCPWHIRHLVIKGALSHYGRARGISGCTIGHASEILLARRWISGYPYRHPKYGSEV